MRPFVVFIILMAVFPLQGSATDTLKLDEVIVSARYSPAVYTRLARIVNVLDAGVIQEMPAGNIQDRSAEASMAFGSYMPRVVGKPDLRCQST